MKLRKEEIPIALEMPVATFRVAEWANMAVAYVQLTAGVDATPLLKGLPDDKCQCPHWGYILEGAIHVRYRDGKEEVCRAGEMFDASFAHSIGGDWRAIRPDREPSRPHGESPVDFA